MSVLGDRESLGGGRVEERGFNTPCSFFSHIHGQKPSRHPFSQMPSLTLPSAYVKVPCPWYLSSLHSPTYLSPSDQVRVPKQFDQEDFSQVLGQGGRSPPVNPLELTRFDLGVVHPALNNRTAKVRHRIAVRFLIGKV